MASDVSLQNKYDRLCIEFNKLRKKHKEYKDSTNKQLEGLQQTIREKDILIGELGGECDQLKSKIGCDPGNLKASVLTPPECNGRSQTNLSLAAEKENPTECSLLDPTSTRCTVSTSDDDKGDIILGLTSALQQWTTAIGSRSSHMARFESESVLAKQISQLQCEVSDLSVQLQLERKRRFIKDKEVSGESQPTTPQSSPASARSESDLMMIEFLSGRVASSMEQAQYATSIAAFLQDELRSVAPYLTCLARELQEARSEVRASRSTIQRLDEELEGLRHSTLKQNNEMAKHVANLTEELQTWRCYSSASGSSPTSNSARQKKNPLMNVLKR